MGNYVMKKIIVFFLLSTFYFLLTIPAHAGYVLPYPSYMPGNKLYNISRVIDSLKAYWYWGNIAKVKYHLGLANKYLVESKTLFEYKQYLLATDALARSDTHVDNVLPYLKGAAVQGKDVKVLETTVGDAMLVHISVIETMKSQLPEKFIWRPEKASEIILPISSMLQHALTIRQNLRDEAK